MLLNESDHHQPLIGRENGNDIHPKISTLSALNVEISVIFDCLFPLNIVFFYRTALL